MSNNIDFGRITKDNREFFYRLGIKEVFDLLDGDNFYMIAAMTNGLPAGIIGFQVFQSSGTASINITWLFIDTDYRKKGIGTALVNYVKDIAERIEGTQYNFAIPDEYASENLEAFLNAIIKKCSQSNRRAFNHTLGELKQNVSFNYNVLDTTIINFSKVPKFLFSQFTKTLPDALKNTIPLEYFNNASMVDPNLSSIYLFGNDSIGAAFLIHTDSAGRVRPFLLVNKITNMPVLLFKTIVKSFKYLCDNFDDDTVVRFICSNSEVEHLLKKLFPNLTLNEHFEIQMQLSKEE